MAHNVGFQLNMAEVYPEISVIQPSFCKIVNGLLGSEGPVFDKDGVFFMVAAEVEKDGKPAGQVLRVDLQNGQSCILYEPSVDGNGGIPEGCQCDREGNLWIADMRLGIIKVTQTGELNQICTKDSEGRVMQGCNDCIFDYHGNLWVTAPAGEIAPSPYREGDYRRPMEEPFGSVYCLTRDGQVKRAATGLQYPNGIAILDMDDERPNKLIVAETPTKFLLSFDIVEPGKVQNKEVWGRLPGDLEGGPDGMDFDEENNLLVAHWGSGHIEVFSPQGGEPVKRIQCPFSKPTNLHFKPDSKTVVVTEQDTHGLWKFEWERRGKRMFCETL